jgi:hypothetical protein
MVTESLHSLGYAAKRMGMLLFWGANALFLFAVVSHLSNTSRYPLKFQDDVYSPFEFGTLNASSCDVSKLPITPVFMQIHDPYLPSISIKGNWSNPTLLPPTCKFANRVE